jgi:rod shape-determining protein MreC
LAILVLLAVTALVLDRNDVGPINRARDVATTAFSPLDDAAEAVGAPVTDAWNGWTGNDNIDELTAENRQLKQELASIRAERVRSTDAVHQLEQLTKSLHLPWTGSLPKVTAQVISGPRSNFSHAVEINRGSDEGIKLGMPAVTAGGLVGKVSQVAHGRSTIELITDPAFRVGVRMASTGSLGTARGQGAGQPLVVDTSLTADAKVKPGAALATSGVDRSAFPGAIPVGKVRATRAGAGGMSLDLLVDPLVDVDDLSYVSVLLWEPPQ